MQYLDVSNPFYREKEDREIYKGDCKTCIYFNADTKICERYNMITDPFKTCKSHR